MPNRTSPRKRTILFDWGNTLMVEIPGAVGPMVNWPRVETVQGAGETLARLSKDYRLSLATNAVESTEEQIWGALRRCELADYISRVYCFRTIGEKKPSVAFFNAVLEDLGAAPEDILMVGDSLENDVIGAIRSGLKAVWLNKVDEREQKGPGFCTIHHLRDLPAAVRSLFRMDADIQV